MLLIYQLPHVLHYSFLHQVWLANLALSILSKRWRQVAKIWVEHSISRSDSLCWVVLQHVFEQIHTVLVQGRHKVSQAVRRRIHRKVSLSAYQYNAVRHMMAQ